MKVNKAYIGKLIIIILLVVMMAEILSAQNSSRWRRQGKYLINNVTREYVDFWKEDYNWPIINKNWDAIAIKTLRGTRWSVLLNNNPGTFYTEVKHLQFSPSGDTLVYVGMQGVNKLFRRALSVRIAEEREERLYDDISPTIFTSDGKSWAYRIRDDDDYYLVVNGVESKRYDDVNDYSFSPDGTTLVFRATLKGKNFLVINGEEGKRYDEVFAITFNPVNSEVVYWGRQGKNFFLVSNGTELNVSKQTAPTPKSILFNPTGRSFAYFVRDVFNDSYYVVQDGVYSNPYDRIKFEKALYSRDGTTLAYPAGKGNQEFIVLNGREEEKYDAVSDPVFSNDNFSIIYAANQGNKWFAVINRRKEKRYDMVKETIFSPSGNSYSYFAKRNNKWFVVRNGVEGTELFDDVSNLRYSPDGTKLIFIATIINRTYLGSEVRVNRRERVIVDSESSNDYSKIYSVRVSNNNKISFIVEDYGGYFVVTDNDEGELFDSILSLELSPDRLGFGYFGIQNDRIYWVSTN